GCWNIGDVTTNLNRVGGLFGSNTKNNVKVQSSWNAGNVETTATAAGLSETNGAYAIGGLAGIAAAKFYDCFNLGNVKGMTQVGGIVGRPALNMTGLFNCYNSATVQGPAEQTGNLIGVNTSDKQQWSTANKATSCYYTTDGGKCTLDASIGTAVNVAALCKTDMGSGWTSAGEYMLPLPTQFAGNDAALLYAAMVVPADNENLSAITSPFHVGTPAGLKWSSDVADITFNGNQVSFASFTGSAVLTATLGDFMKSVKIVINGTTGIDEVELSAVDVKSEVWFDAAGRAVNASSAMAGQMYIVVRTYSDNTSKVFKICK
ncbi:MAG: hypothetical protein K2M65_04510, partial [Muribaculaceae bacterium]|nr:hypothetical protein [Muribaculaceae bacterium]